MDSNNPRSRRKGRVVPKWSGQKPAAAGPSGSPPAKYRVELTSGAVAQLRELPIHVQRQIAKKIDLLKNDPRPPGYKQLKGDSGFYRLRSGDYRILYTFEGGSLVVTVVRLSHRKDVYEGL